MQSITEKIFTLEAIFDSQTENLAALENMLHVSVFLGEVAGKACKQESKEEISKVKSTIKTYKKRLDVLRNRYKAVISQFESSKLSRQLLDKMHANDRTAFNEIYELQQQQRRDLNNYLADMLSRLMQLQASTQSKSRQAIQALQNQMNDVFQEEYEEVEAVATRVTNRQQLPQITFKLV